MGRLIWNSFWAGRNCWKTESFAFLKYKYGKGGEYIPINPSKYRPKKGLNGKKMLIHHCFFISPSWCFGEVGSSMQTLHLLYNEEKNTVNLRFKERNYILTFYNSKTQNSPENFLWDFHLCSQFTWETANQPIAHFLISWRDGRNKSHWIRGPPTITIFLSRKTHHRLCPIHADTIIQI